MLKSTPAPAGATGSFNVTSSRVHLPTPGEQAVEFAEIPSTDAMDLAQASMKAEMAAEKSRSKAVIEALSECLAADGEDRCISVTMPHGVVASFSAKDPVAAMARLIKLVM